VVVRPDSFGAPITAEHLDDFLDSMQTLAGLLERDLIDIETVEEWYGVLISKAARHPDVLAHIRKAQREENDTDLFSGLEEMAKAISKVRPPKPTTPTIRQSPAR